MVSAFELIYAMISEILQLDKIAVARMTSKVIQGRRQQCANWSVVTVSVSCIVSETLPCA